ncbi:MAG: acylphosphatase [Betaproteobacteria bacterium RIFCSPLOWO2_02_FULL_66_14]|nr:MAG: acylphosphatase [Betaproteobacteria bacterium RIFCSPLOWO2_02_FULL_66_14]
MDVTRHLRVFGLVQGVGYREALRAEADRLGVRGWVRNRRDGSVEAVAQGAPEAVDALIAWVRRGPPAARVTQVDVQPAAAGLDRSYPDFDRLPSA